VQCEDECLSLTSVLLDSNSPLEPQLQTLTVELLQQNPQSSIASTNLNLFSWMFFEDDGWYKVTNIKHLLWHTKLGFLPISRLYIKNESKESNNTSNGENEQELSNEYFELQDLIMHDACTYIYVNPLHFMSPPSLYFFCDLSVHTQSGDLCAVRGGIFMERLFMPPTSRCRYMWCNSFLLKNPRESALVLKGSSKPVLAVYCSVKCAMSDRKEILVHTQKSALKSFRFLVQRTPEDIRLLRLLRMIHDQLEHNVKSNLAIIDSE